jgi:hypothetical protein
MSSKAGTNGFVVGQLNVIIVVRRSTLITILANLESAEAISAKLELLQPPEAKDTCLPSLIGLATVKTTTKIY